jgi:hypothetical protein
MKLTRFHLMPYTELPEDFRDENPAVWVDIHCSLFDPTRAHHMHNDFTVMPQLHAVFSEWEDRWWPQPLERAARAALARFQFPAMAAE